ncbi:hypothetical protein HFP51_02095 [Parasphingopyxis sp. CP4]|uniref:GSCFA domain-containing protein n=1 Tax=Parasphingopyxis sp. CP4 TaxID=2724527 RepID=UPI00159FDCFF|nr:GSCFA domain-containing protein [Parasphingopyxis sp. CP4]QLC21083.1 hypothetical protein HFP51_02095 [Parasphingopyxis sp. CP4]
MAILKIPSTTAIQTLKSNKVSNWGNRTDQNRVEPIAAPAFEAPFQLSPGEKIYTIGSCFARHVETKLIEQGFDLPMRNLFEAPEFEGLHPNIVNNFGTPSIFNEIAWAFDEVPFDEDTAFLKMAPDKYTDLHMVSSLRPAPIEILRQRRARLFDATRSLADCRVVIMTLGLIEIWWDEEAGLYLNTQPPRSAHKENPDRFSLHVLGVDECVDYLERTIDIMVRHGKPDLQMVLTVSPVPMTSTHRPIDVMIANTYSKSVLRVVAEYIVSKHDQVTYFPSYETVTLSNRQLSWMDDFVHVRDEMIGFNVERMVNAYSGNARTADIALATDVAANAEDVETGFMAEKARQARLDSDADFFREHAEHSASSPSFAIEHARYLLDEGEYAEALRIIEDDDSIEAQLVTAKCLIGTKDFDEAIKTAWNVCLSPNKGMNQWRVLLEATAARGMSIEELEEIEEKWLPAAPGAQHMVKFLCGSALRRSGFPEQGLERLTFAIEDSRSVGTAIIEYARCLIDIGDVPAAIEKLRGFEGDNEHQKFRVQNILKRAEAMLESN